MLIFGGFIIGILTAIIAQWLGYGIDTIQHWVIFAIGLAPWIIGNLIWKRSK